MSALARQVRNAFFAVHDPEIIYTSTFRWFSVLCGGCAICMLLTAGFIYWRTSSYVIAGIDRSVADLAETFAILRRQPDSRRFENTSTRIRAT